MSNAWPDLIGDVTLMLLGAAISLYATIVFERYKRFGEIMREVALARLYAEAYPVSPRDVDRAHRKAFDTWRLLEERQWALDAEGHHGAALQVARLVGFTYRTIACLERMRSDLQMGNPVDHYLAAFQSEYARIRDQEFVRFPEGVRPSLRALWRPVPQSILPARRVAVPVTYFDGLL